LHSELSDKGFRAGWFNPPGGQTVGIEPKEGEEEHIFARLDAQQVDSEDKFSISRTRATVEQKENR